MNVMFTWAVREEYRVIKELSDAFHCGDNGEIGVFEIDETVECELWVTCEVKFNVPGLTLSWVSER